jgi:CHAT domain-containing protein
MNDDRLTVRAIAHQQLPSRELAFVSACETFRGGSRLPDESITLAGALQLAGYGHVIATQWQLFGGRNTQIVATFYDEVVRRDGAGAVSLEKVAGALRTAMLGARTAPDYARPFYWASYIHTGP